jgi:pilus assembly protein CpaE
LGPWPFSYPSFPAWNERAGLTVAGDARYGATAAAAADELRPDAIVVGIEEPPNRALETIESLAELLIETPIVAYSSLGDPGIVRRATRAGVRDYLIRPIGSDALREAVFAALEREERQQLRRAGQFVPPARGSVITVSGAKGGVGKSVVAINLALALRTVTGRSVALVDADTHFGDVATMLNMPRGEPITQVIGIADELDRGSLIEHSMEHPSGMRVLPGPVAPDEWDTITLEKLGRVLGLLAEAFDFVVIDTPDVFDAVVRECISSSTLNLLITSLDMSSIADTRAAYQILHRWGFPDERVRLVVNPTRKTSGLHSADVQTALGRPVFWTVPFESRVPQMAQLGESAVVKAPKLAFSRNMSSLAEVISGSKHLSPSGKVAGPRRLFGLLPIPATSG